MLALLAAPAAAQSYVVTEEWVVEEWVIEETTASRYVSPLLARTEQVAIAAYGPFRVIDATTVALVGITDGASPAQFAALLDAYPAIATLEFVEAPGTHDDRANLRLGRMIRERGIATRVEDGGSVRSGAVELFLAGATRQIDSRSQFAVHGWLDDWGRGAEDYPANAPEHRRYLDYYVEMGMDEAEARAFYAMTNAVPFEDAMWLTGDEMRGWVEGASQTPAVATEAEELPGFAYLDFAPVLQ
ncbi:alpha/beta hydrolase [Aurantiacibacter sp. MUD11]|uniref:alpha/beta hydrolase n=1 Tax=Aurantiacibacter sp. MUD11 TaxID=3003265 RepID=UPI0022AB0E71|nr:alpha/beta hydrolase [Aurantiacibacter sp. MUD11]WAT16795.1 alpha/beta hydrolase [Aurantiacibacter sp. MUD11]